LPDLIEAAANGEKIVISKDDQHIVKLLPIARPNPARSSVTQLRPLTIAS